MAKLPFARAMMESNYTFQLLGRRIETAGEVTEYEPHSKYSFKATSGPFPIEGGFTFEEVEGGTKVTEAGELEIGGFFRLAEPLVVRMLQRGMESEFSNLKDLLEAGA